MDEHVVTRINAHYYVCDRCGRAGSAGRSCINIRRCQTFTTTEGTDG